MQLAKVACKLHHAHVHLSQQQCNLLLASILQSADYSYNYVTWTGGEYAYRTCDLADRGATYVGTCKAAVTCNTTLTKDTVDTSLSDVSYSCSTNSTGSSCAATCDQQDWCQGLCFCASNCTSTQVYCCSFCMNTYCIGQFKHVCMQLLMQVTDPW